MRLVDVNILVYAHRKDAPDHHAYLKWWKECADSNESFGMCDPVLAGFLRVVTHPRVFNPPTPTTTALHFAEEVRSHPNCVEVRPGARHWEIFLRLCRVTSAAGNHVPDAYLAALAIESGSEWITTNRGYSRFPDLRWRHPLQG
jgi:toxin-antitoxin system PIN domain toxin